RRHQAVVVAHADVRAEDLVLVGDGPQVVDELVLDPRRRKLQPASQPDVGGHRLVDERVERRRAEPLEHLGDLGLVGADVPGGEGVGGRERRGSGAVLDRGARAIAQRYFASLATYSSYSAASIRSPPGEPGSSFTRIIQPAP